MVKSQRHCDAMQHAAGLRQTLTGLPGQNPNPGVRTSAVHQRNRGQCNGNQSVYACQTSPWAPPNTSTPTGQYFPSGGYVTWGNGQTPRSVAGPVCLNPDSSAPGRDRITNDYPVSQMTLGTPALMTGDVHCNAPLDPSLKNPQYPTQSSHKRASVPRASSFPNRPLLPKQKEPQMSTESQNCSPCFSYLGKVAHLGVRPRGRGHSSPAEAVTTKQRDGANNSGPPTQNASSPYLYRTEGMGLVGVNGGNTSVGFGLFTPGATPLVVLSQNPTSAVYAPVQKGAPRAQHGNSAPNGEPPRTSHRPLIPADGRPIADGLAGCGLGLSLGNSTVQAHYRSPNDVAAWNLALGGPSGPQPQKAQGSVEMTSRAVEQTSWLVLPDNILSKLAPSASQSHSGNVLPVASLGDTIVTPDGRIGVWPAVTGDCIQVQAPVSGPFNAINGQTLANLGVQPHDQPSNGNTAGNLLAQYPKNILMITKDERGNVFFLVGNQPINFNPTSQALAEKPSSNHTAEADRGRPLGPACSHDEVKHGGETAEDPVFNLPSAYSKPNMSAGFSVRRAVAVVPPISQQFSNSLVQQSRVANDGNTPPLKVQSVADQGVGQEPGPKPRTPHLPVHRTHDAVSGPSSNHSRLEKIASSRTAFPETLSAGNPQATPSLDPAAPLPGQACSTGPSMLGDSAAETRELWEPCRLASSPGSVALFTVPPAKQSPPVNTSPCETEIQAAVDAVKKGDQGADLEGSVLDLSTVPVIEWTSGKLSKLIADLEVATELSERELDVTEAVMTQYWDNSFQKFCDHMKADLYRTVVREAWDVCSKAESLVVFSEIDHAYLRKVPESCQVLKHGEDYHGDMAYESSWLNLNEQLDDIDKEYGFPVSLRVGQHALGEEDSQPRRKERTCRKTQDSGMAALQAQAPVPALKEAGTEDPLSSIRIRVLSSEDARRYFYCGPSVDERTQELRSEEPEQKMREKEREVGGELAEPKRPPELPPASSVAGSPDFVEVEVEEVYSGYEDVLKMAAAMSVELWNKKGCKTQPQKHPLERHRAEVETGAVSSEPVEAIPKAETLTLQTRSPDRPKSVRPLRRKKSSRSKSRRQGNAIESLKTIEGKGVLCSQPASEFGKTTVDPRNHDELPKNKLKMDHRAESPESKVLLPKNDKGTRCVQINPTEAGKILLNGKCANLAEPKESARTVSLALYGSSSQKRRVAVRSNRKPGAKPFPARPFADQVLSPPLTISLNVNSVTRRPSKETVRDENEVKPAVAKLKSDDMPQDRSAISRRPPKRKGPDSELTAPGSRLKRPTRKSGGSSLQGKAGPDSCGRSVSRPPAVSQNTRSSTPALLNGESIGPSLRCLNKDAPRARRSGAGTSSAKRGTVLARLKRKMQSLRKPPTASVLPDSQARSKFEIGNPAVVMQQKDFLLEFKLLPKSFDLSFKGGRDLEETKTPTRQNKNKVSPKKSNIDRTSCLKKTWKIHGDWSKSSEGKDEPCCAEETTPRTTSPASQSQIIFEEYRKRFKAKNNN